jgi:hypothetical protein
VVVASPAALADALDRLARATGIDQPVGQGFLDSFDGVGATSIIGGVGITRAMLDRLDPARPVTAVGLMPGIGVPTGFCVAATFRDAAGARRTLDEIGPEARRLGSASFRALHAEKGAAAGKPPTVAAALSGRTLLLASTEATLLKAGAPAIALQATPPTDEVAVTIHMDAIGPGGLALMRAAMAKGMIDVAERLRRNPMAKVNATIMKAVEALGTIGMRPLAEIRTLRLALDVSADAGLALRLEVDPIPGTSLARWATPNPYHLDPTLPIGDDGTIVASWGSVATGFALFEELVDPTGPAGRALRKDLEAFAPSFARGGSCVIDAAAMPFKSYCTWDLKAGQKPAGVLDRYGAVVKASHAWSLEVLPRGPGAPKMRRQRDVLEIDEPLGSKDDNAAARAVRKVVFGGDLRRSAVTVKDGRLMIAQGPEAHDMLPTMTRASAGTPPPGAPILADTLARTQGSDGLLFVDPVSLIVRIAETATDPSVRQLGVMVSAVPGLATLRMPMVLTMRSHDGVAYQLALPRASVENVVRLIRPYLGTMGAGKAAAAAPGASEAPGKATGGPAGVTP